MRTSVALGIPKFLEDARSMLSRLLAFLAASFNLSVYLGGANRLGARLWVQDF